VQVVPLLRPLAPVAVLVALGAGCDLGDDGETSAVERADVIVEFVAVEEFARTPPADVDEGIRAGLTTVARNKTRIIIEVIQQSEPLRAEVHIGTCDFLTSEGPEYQLNDVEHGESETVIDVPLPELRGARGPGYVIMLRRPEEPSARAGLCGDLFTAEEND
jgi:hypothetical protein